MSEKQVFIILIWLSEHRFDPDNMCTTVLIHGQFFVKRRRNIALFINAIKQDTLEFASKQKPEQVVELYKGSNKDHGLDNFYNPPTQHVVCLYMHTVRIRLSQTFKLPLRDFEQPINAKNRKQSDTTCK